MITFLLIALLVVMVPAFAALYQAVHRAADGYEDELQFHAGVGPEGIARVAAATPAPAWVAGARGAKRAGLAPTGRAQA